MRSIMAVAAAAGLVAMAINTPALAQCAGKPGATRASCARHRTHVTPNRGYHHGYSLTYNNGSNPGYNNGWTGPSYHDYGYFAPEGGYYPSGGFDYGSPGGTFLGVPGYHGDF